MATTAADFDERLTELNRLVDDGLATLRRCATELADAEHSYRLAKAKAWVRAPKGTVPEREAWVDAETAEDRRLRDLAELTRQAALEAVRTRRTQMSAEQSKLNAHSQEAQLLRYGQDVGP